MKLIPSATVYKAELPHAEVMETLLAKLPFTEIAPTDFGRSGFVPVFKDATALVAPFHGGYAFKFRYDEKVIPPTAKRRETDKRIRAIESRGAILSRNDRREIGTMVMDELVQRAIAKTTEVTCFYDTANQYLIVPVASEKLASLIVSQLVKACDSIKFTSIVINGMAVGLTARLERYLSGEHDIFGSEMNPDGAVTLEHNDTGDKIAFSLNSSLDTSIDGIKEALAAGFDVKSLGMSIGMLRFKLASNFIFRSIKFDATPSYEQSSFADYADEFAEEAAVQVFSFSSVITELCNLFGHQWNDES